MTWKSYFAIIMYNVAMYHTYYSKKINCIIFCNLQTKQIIIVLDRKEKYIIISDNNRNVI